MKKNLYTYVGFFLLMLTLINSNSYSQISLLKDINTSQSTTDSSPSGFIVLGSYIYYAASDGVNGRELWRNDGTQAGTTLVKDINPGDGSGISGTGRMTLIGNYIYFAATNGEDGTELWRTDGTANGTIMVSDIYQGADSSSPSSFTVINSTTLYFTADDGINGNELWKIDITNNALTLVDINGGAGSSSPYDLTYVTSSTVYFAASDGSGTELWKYDGSSASRISDIATGTIDSSPNYLTLLNGNVYFTASDATGDRELYVTNGTQAGTTVLPLNDTGSTNPTYITAMNGWVYFSANSGSGVFGTELYRSNGGTPVRVTDIESGAGSSSPLNLLAVGTTLFFSAFNSTNGRELYRTTGGSPTLIDIYAGASSSSPGNLTNIGGTLYFSATDNVYGNELCKISTSATSPTIVDIIIGAVGSSPSGFTLMGSTVFFSADNGSGSELWKISTSSTTATQVSELIFGTSASSPSSFVFDGNGTTYFVATDGSTGYELWKTNGIPASQGGSTTRVADINIGSGSSSPSYLTMVGTMLYFKAYNGSTYNLYRYNGTSLTDLGSVSPDYLFALNSTTLIFQGNDATNGNELWACTNSGSPALVENINNNPQSSSSNPTNFTVHGNYVYYSANDGVNGTELWRISTTSAPTAATNSLFANINTAASTSSSPASFFSTGSLLYFRANGGTGSELWYTNGTNAPVLTKDINTTSSGASSSPVPVGLMGNKLLLVASDGVNGTELWTTDITNQSTVLVKDIRPGAISSIYSSSQIYFSIFNNQLYFLAGDGTHGYEIWTSDGTANGTKLFLDLNPGSVSSYFSYPIISGSSLYFRATDGTGYNIFVTDGVRDCATFMVPYTGQAQISSADYLVAMGSKMIFSMIAQGFDREPFILDPSMVTIPVNTAINTQPISQSKTVGSAVTFTVAVTGTNLTYQWQKNDVDIPSANSISYTIASVVGSDAAQYRCLVSGTCGNLISNNATLTVTAAEPTAQPTAILFTNPSASGFTVSFTAATDNPTGYLAIRRLNDSPTGAPQDNTIYSVGNAIGDGVVAFVGAGVSFVETLTPAAYGYDIFSYNETNGTINYKIDNPLEGMFAADNTPPLINNETPPSLESPTTTDLKIVATITENESSVDPGGVKVQYRSISTGAAFSSEQDMTLNSGKWEFTVPATVNGDLGVEYKITATNNRALTSSLTAITTLTYSELAIPFTVFGSTQDKYRIISVPLELNSKSLSDLLVDDLGTYDKKLWRMYRYENAEGKTVEMSTSSSIETGKGYWLIVKDTKTLDTSLGKTVSVSEGVPYKITLSQGWNLIGNPYPFNIQWSDVQNASGVTYALRTYDGNYNASDTKLDKFEGAFVFATAAGMLTFPVKRNPDAGRITMPAGLRNTNPLSHADWEVTFRLRNGILINETGGVGMNAKASDQQDQFDDFTLPRFQDYLELNHQKRFANTAFTKDIVQTSRNHEWDFSVETSLTGISELWWDNSYFGEGETALVLWDEAELRAVDMRVNDRYLFNSASRSFKIFYGNSEYVKEMTKVNNLVLHHVIPNPTAGQAQIAFTLPGEAESNVQVRVLNTLGQSVSTVYSGTLPGGYHELSWDGKDASGCKPAQGVYLVEVWQSKTREIKRLIVK
jgi:ELWxxDGT repeat protein